MYQQNKSNLQERNIILTDVADNGNQIVITDQNGVKYSFFKTKKAGGNSAAYNDLMSFSMNDNIAVVFEVNGNFNNVARLKPAEAQSSPTPISASLPAPTHFESPTPTNFPHQLGVVSPTFNKDKMIGVLALMKVANVSLEQLEKAETWNRFGNAYELGKQALSEVPANTTSSAISLTPPPTPVYAGDINVEDIPF